MAPFERLRRRPLTYAVVLVGLALATACATTRSPGEQMDDASIAAQVKSKIAADAEVNPFEIDVDVQQGVVTLSGSVEEPGDKRKAEELAQNTEGVVRVQNDITIGDPTVGENLDDAALLTKIKTKLTTSGGLSPFNIDVDVKRGVVTLLGTVRSEENKQEAERIARETSGVRQVNNRLTVQGGAEDHDPDSPGGT